MSSSTERAPLLGSNETYASVESQETNAPAEEIAQESAIEASTSIAPLAACPELTLTRSPGR